MASTSLRAFEQARTRVSFVATATAVALLAAACGGFSGIDASFSSNVTSSTSMPTTTVTADVTTTSTTTIAVTTTRLPPVEVSPVMDPGEIAGLVAQWAAGAGSTLDLAESIISFPIEIGTPAGATPFSLKVGLSMSSPAEPWTWDWTYGARSPIAEIDSALPDGGPGVTDTAAFYDPIMADLGWHRAARVISSPGSGNDGPRSVNFAYEADFEALSVGDLSAAPVVAMAWAMEDLNFMPGPDDPGYRIDLRARLAPGLIPVPVLATLVSELPSAADATLTNVSLMSMERSPDSFDADLGLRYFEVEFDFDLPNGSADAAYEAYSTGLDGTIYQVGSANMSSPGRILPVAPNIYNNTWSQKVVVLGRYRGSIDVIADPATGDAKANVRLTLDPNRVDLVP